MRKISNDKVVAYDAFGYPFNQKHPPSMCSRSNKYHGYPDPFRETIFYDFAVQGYDLEFSYKGKTYHCVNVQLGVDDFLPPLDEGVTKSVVKKFRGI